MLPLQRSCTKPRERYGVYPQQIGDQTHLRLDPVGFQKPSSKAPKNICLSPCLCGIFGYAPPDPDPVTTSGFLGPEKTLAAGCGWLFQRSKPLAKRRRAVFFVWQRCLSGEKLLKACKVVTDPAGLGFGIQQALALRFHHFGGGFVDKTGVRQLALGGLN